MEREYNIIETLNMPEGTMFKVIYPSGIESADNVVVKKDINYGIYLSWCKFGKVERITKSLTDAKFIKVRKEYNFFEAMQMIGQGKKMTNESLPTKAYYKKSEQYGIVYVNGYGEENRTNICNVEFIYKWHEYIEE